ncbi:MAG: ABC transporter permease [Oscillospiraceae bacterium]
MPWLVLSWLVTAGGFFIAAAMNLYYPQKKSIFLIHYTVVGQKLDMNDAYRRVLYAIAALYTIVFLVALVFKSQRRKFISRAPFRFVAGLALGAWDIMGTKLQILPQPFFPGPAKVVESFLMDGAYILQNTLYSLRLFSVGFLLGVLFGVGTGIIIGWFPKIYYWVYPVLKLTGVIPAVAWMPFALTLFAGSPFSAAAFLIVICAWFPVAFLTAQGITSTPRLHFEAARTLGAKTPYLVFHVAIPHALPQIFTGISTANAYAFTTLVMSEMMGQPGGLGYYINQSKVWSSYYKVFAAIVVMALLFSAIMQLIGAIQKRALRWQRGILK